MPGGLLGSVGQLAWRGEAVAGHERALLFFQRSVVLGHADKEGRLYQLAHAVERVRGDVIAPDWPVNGRKEVRLVVHGVVVAVLPRALRLPSTRGVVEELEPVDQTKGAEVTLLLPLPVQEAGGAQAMAVHGAHLQKESSTTHGVGYISNARRVCLQQARCCAALW